ncbi:uncharacterized protein K444DRAFT_547622, partial [Hyaloscypha bicolor E]
EGMDLVLEEIKTFNKGLEPIGQPYWATSKEKRDSGLQRAGSVVVAFPTEIQANRAIKNRLLIAGISTKVVKYHTISSTAQYTKYTGYGHLDSICKKDPKCLLYGKEHVTENHFCSIYKKKVIQEPWIIVRDSTNRGYHSIIHPSYFQILPNYSTLRPRTLVYIARELQASLAQNSPSDPDYLIIDLSLGVLKMQLINFYNAVYPEDPNNILTILREDILPTTLLDSSLLLGDFNTYYPW